MKFKSIKPYITILLLTLFAVAVTICLLTSGIFEVKFRFTPVTILMLFMIVVCFCLQYVRILWIGVKGIYDFVFQKTKEDVYKYYSIEPLHIKTVAAKRKYGIEAIYLIQVYNKRGTFFLVSSEYLELHKNELYRIKTGKHSNLCLSVDKMEKVYL